MDIKTPDQLKEAVMAALDECFIRDDCVEGARAVINAVDQELPRKVCSWMSRDCSKSVFIQNTKNGLSWLFSLYLPGPVPGAQRAVHYSPPFGAAPEVLQQFYDALVDGSLFR